MKRRPVSVIMSTKRRRDHDNGGEQTLKGKSDLLLTFSHQFQYLQLLQLINQRHRQSHQKHRPQIAEKNLITKKAAVVRAVVKALENLLGPLWLWDGHRLWLQLPSKPITTEVSIWEWVLLVSKAAKTFIWVRISHHCTAKLLGFKRNWKKTKAFAGSVLWWKLLAFEV